MLDGKDLALWKKWRDFMNRIKTQRFVSGIKNIKGLAINVFPEFPETLFFQLNSQDAKQMHN